MKKKDKLFGNSYRELSINSIYEFNKYNIVTPERLEETDSK